MAVIIVEPADSPPVRYRGRVNIRIGPRRGIASAQDERILNEKRRHRDAPFDVQPVPTAVLADLNKRSFEEEYLPSAIASDILAENNRSFEQRLAAAKMIATVDDPKYYTKPWVVAQNTYRWIPPDFAVYGTTGEYDEEFCVPSEMISYFNTVALPASQDEVTGKK